MSQQELALIIPVFNEEAIVPILVKRLGQVFTKSELVPFGITQTRFIFVDDGSADKTVSLLKEHAKQLPGHLEVHSFSRNFGHQAAVSCGLMKAQGSAAVAILDADLQDPPEVVLQMLAQWKNGFDVVYGQRKNRKESFLKVFLYWGFYRIYRMLTPIEVPLDSGDFCLMSGRVVTELNKLEETIRFPRGLRSWIGFKQTGVPYDRPERAAGESKYDFKKLYQLATDGIASLSIRPLQLAQTLSLGYLFSSTLAFVYLLSKSADASREDFRFYFLLLLILMSNGLILFCIYILGAYISRSYLEIKKRPNHIVADSVFIEQK